MDETTFFENHRWEIIFAAVFAVTALIFLEIIRHPFCKLYRKLLAPRISRLIKKVINRGEQVLHEAEILNSIHSNFRTEAPPKYIADAIKKHNSLTVNKRFHYVDILKKYHLFRKFKLFPILNGDEAFFTEICRAIAEQIDFQDINLTLCMKKEANSLFSRKLSDSYPGRIKAHTLSYKENEKGLQSEIRYEEGESLLGTNVIFLESLLIFPETIIESIEWIQSQGATVKKIVILFDATNSLIDFAGCGINAQDVIIGSSINLELVTSDSCRCGNKGNLKTLKYNEY